MGGRGGERKIGGFLRGRTLFSGGKGGDQWSSTENKGWNIEHRLQITITTNKGRGGGESQSNMEDQVHNQNPPPPLPFSCPLGRIKVQIQGVERLTSWDKRKNDGGSLQERELSFRTKGAAIITRLRWFEKFVGSRWHSYIYLTLPQRFVVFFYILMTPPPLLPAVNFL